MTAACIIKDPPGVYWGGCVATKRSTALLEGFIKSRRADRASWKVVLPPIALHQLLRLAKQ